MIDSLGLGLHYCLKTGIWSRWFKTYRTQKVGIWGYKTNHGYLHAKHKGRMKRLHRLAFVYMGIDPTGYQVDHINGIRDDNRWENLRLVTDQENRLNRNRHRDGRHPYVLPSGKHWVVRRMKDGKFIYYDLSRQKKRL